MDNSVQSGRIMVPVRYSCSLVFIEHTTGYGLRVYLVTVICSYMKSRRYGCMHPLSNTVGTGTRNPGTEGPVKHVLT